jgi:hypothetical protein
MYFLTTADAAELKLQGMEFEVSAEKGILVEEKDFAVRQKEMNFKCDLTQSEFDGIMSVDNIRFPEAAAAKPAVAESKGLDPEFLKGLLDQANASMRENIKLINYINKLKPKS